MFLHFPYIIEYEIFGNIKFLDASYFNADVNNFSSLEFYIYYYLYVYFNIRLIISDLREFVGGL
jgi:hypothetical protein